MSLKAVGKYLLSIDYKKIFFAVWNALSPIIYLVVWYFFIKFSSETLFLFDMNPDLFLFLSFLILVFGFITKSTSWSIGHTSFGIKGDSRTRLLNFHKNGSGDSWFDLFGDNPELLKDTKTKALIQDLINGTKQE